jgi:eukaryotic-like serine/threonine-protein kinase
MAVEQDERAGIMTTNPDHFERVEAIFLEVCDLDGEERARRIDTLCDGDATLFSVVRALLEADEVQTSPIDATGLLCVEQHAAGIPDVVGDFEIISVLGEGGMGIVYEAVQRTPRRRVALKVIKNSMITPSALRRFEIEAQILAKLQHPGIATIYDSGIEHTSTGPRPFVAMELVEGKPITAYADSAKLDARARVELIRDVCRAVAHAHERAVIHRDLKPANIFVTKDGAIKVLDFGVAFDTESQHNTLLTQHGQLVGTLPYMAPEQVAADGVRADIRTDVYAIGLIGYELLTGVRPHTDTSGGAYELIRAIREDEPSLAGSINRALRGDIETILAKAMEKDPARRYQSADELADDLDRHLASRPIVARRASAWYQLQKFSKRNPAIVASTGAIFVVLVVAIALIAGALRTAQRDRDEARHNDYISSAMNSFVFDDLFAAADPERDGDADITLLDAMRTASLGLTERFSESPEVEAELRESIGQQYLVMNQLEDAKIHLERGLELSRTLDLGPEVMIGKLNDISMLYADLDDLDMATQILDESLALLEANPDLPDETRIDTLVNIASNEYHKGDIEAAAKTFERSVKLGRAVAPEYDGTISAIHSLALVYQRLDRFDDAASLQLEANDLSERLNGRHHPDTLIGLNNLALLYLKIDRVDDAIALLNEVLEVRLDIFGTDHVQTNVTRAMLGRAHKQAGQYDLAEPYLLESFDRMKNAIGKDHRYTLIAEDLLHDLYTQWDKPDQAALYQKQGE